MRSTLKAALVAMLGIGAGLAARAFRQALLASRQGERQPDEKAGSGARPSRGGAAENGSGAAERGAVAAGPTRAQLYEEAKRRGIRGRSQMTKAQLAEALDRDTQD